MTTPAPSEGITWAEALAAAAATKTTPSSENAVASTVAQLAESVIAAREHAVEFVLGLLRPRWARLDVYDGKAVQAFTETAAGYMQTAQTMTARVTAAAQQQQLAAMGIQVSANASNPVDVRGTPKFNDDDSITVVRGSSEVEYSDGKQIVDLDQDATTLGMFNRPARTQRFLQSKGMGSAEARAEAEQRLAVLVGDNMMLAQRLAEAEILAKAAMDTGVVDLQGRPVEARPAEVIGYRRVLHPELSRTGVCGLCIAAADRIYRVRELREVHTNCKCTIAAVTEEFDPADVLNKADLGQLYDLAGGTSGPELKRIRYQTDEHGELGPVLVPAREYKPRTPFVPGPRTNDAPRQRKQRRRARA